MQYLADMFERYKPGDNLNISWDRGNGVCDGEFVYFGVNPFDGFPLICIKSYLNIGVVSFQEISELEDFVLH